MRMINIIFIMAIAWSACTKTGETLPIEEKKMVEILVDVHLAESAMQDLTSAIRDSVGNMYYQQIYKIHGVSKADFDKTIYLLKQNPLQMNEIYKKVLEKLDEDVRSLE